MKRILILILTSKASQDFINLEKSIKNTWVNQKNDNIDYLFYDCDSSISNPIITDKKLIVSCQESWTAIQKTNLAYEYVFKNLEFDYIFRTNLGSFIDYENLYSWIEDKPKTYLCGFSETRYSHDISGSGYWISRDIVESILENITLLTDEVDDLAVGRLCLKLGYSNSPSLRYNIKDYIESIDSGYENEYISFDNKPYHYRLKSKSRNDDVIMMNRLWNNLKINNKT